MPALLYFTPRPSIESACVIVGELSQQLCVVPCARVIYQLGLQLEVSLVLQLVCDQSMIRVPSGREYFRLLLILYIYYNTVIFLCFTPLVIYTVAERGISRVCGILLRLSTGAF